MTDPNDHPSSPADANQAARTDDRGSFLQRVQSAWQKTVGNYATDVEHSRNVFQRLVDFGNITGEEAKRLIADTHDRVEHNRRELEQRVEESLKKATARLTVPTVADVRDLGSKVDDIEGRIAALERESR